MNHSVLLVDDEKNALISMEMTLKLEGYTSITSFSDSKEAFENLKTKEYDLVILDILMPGFSGMDLLRHIRENHPETQVIMATALNDVASAVLSLKEGAFDYILKPLTPERLISSVNMAFKVREIQKDCIRIKDHLFSDSLENPSVFSGFITGHPRMMLIFKYIEAIAATEQGILITGETGVGKELTAKAVHASSGVKGSFVAVNVAGLDDALFSDTLFGHVKGAFTGADATRKGLIEQADSGTLFLDEIGELSPVSQIKLLRLLQEREFSPLGSDQVKICKARIITATLKSIQEIKSSQNFRRDLFYRLQTHHIHLPPLRERKEDIPLLVDHFMEKDCESFHKPVPVIPSELFSLLNSYSFPGNIRELQAMVYDAASRHKSGKLSLTSFKNKINDDFIEESQRESVSPVTDIVFPESLPSLEEIEDRLVEEALKRSGGNQTLAASFLGITRQSLGYRIKTRNLSL